MTSDIKVVFAFFPIPGGGMHLGPAEERPQAGKQIAARETRPKGDATSGWTCAVRAKLCTGCTAGAGGVILCRLSSNCRFATCPFAAQANDLGTKQVYDWRLKIEVSNYWIGQPWLCDLSKFMKLAFETTGMILIRTKKLFDWGINLHLLLGWCVTPHLPPRPRTVEI